MYNEIEGTTVNQGKSKRTSARSNPTHSYESPSTGDMGVNYTDNSQPVNTSVTGTTKGQKRTAFAAAVLGVTALSLITTSLLLGVAASRSSDAAKQQAIEHQKSEMSQQITPQQHIDKESSGEQREYRNKHKRNRRTSERRKIARRSERGLGNGTDTVRNNARQNERGGLGDGTDTVHNNARRSERGGLGDGTDTVHNNARRSERGLVNGTDTVRNNARRTERGGLENHSADMTYNNARNNSNEALYEQNRSIGYYEQGREYFDFLGNKPLHHAFPTITVRTPVASTSQVPSRAPEQVPNTDAGQSETVAQQNAHEVSQ